MGANVLKSTSLHFNNILPENHYYMSPKHTKKVRLGRNIQPFSISLPFSSHASSSSSLMLTIVSIGGQVWDQCLLTLFELLTEVPVLV